MQILARVREDSGVKFPSYLLVIPRIDVNDL